MTGKRRWGVEMNRKGWKIFCVILCGLSLLISISIHAAGKPDVTRHEANFLERAVNVHIEWQSPNPVVLVKVSVANVQKEIQVDPYDNKRNRDGYAGEVNVTLALELVPTQPFVYVIQLEDELRIKSPPVTGKVKVPSSKQPPEAVEYQKPHVEIPQLTLPPVSTPSTPPPGGGSYPVPGQAGGAVIVIITPQTVADAGATWRLGDGQWMRSGEMSSVPAGTYTLHFQAVANWDAPANEVVTIQDGMVSTYNATYVQK